MSEQSKVKNVFLIALGGSGRKLGVTLLERIEGQDPFTSRAIESNIKMISIDFGPGMDSGFYMDPQDCLYLTNSTTNLTKLWSDFEKKKQQLDFDEPWMQVGPISEFELSLARDAQQSGIRRVDYELLVFEAREQIYSKFDQTLNNSFPNYEESNSEIQVVILGSLAGRTGSLVYPVVLSILKSFSNDFNLKTCDAFFYSPSVFQELFYENNERIVNFLVTLPKIKKILASAESSKFKPRHYLLDEEDQLLFEYRDPRIQPYSKIPYSDSFEKILELIQIDGASESSGQEFEKWLQRFETADKQRLEDLIGKFFAFKPNLEYFNEPSLKVSSNLDFDEFFVNLM